MCELNLTNVEPIDNFIKKLNVGVDMVKYALLSNLSNPVNASTSIGGANNINIQSINSNDQI